ncbi:hypothetical protein FACS1894110_07670 [Spirochaetia bacterium]|nr:hypothetical protein FACS1894110_07670 [Spirochaetia bacterium]
MGSYIFILIVIGILLLWIGFTLFFGNRRGRGRGGNKGGHGPSAGKHRRGQVSQESIEEGIAGDPQVCPICSAKLPKGELVKSSAFPSLNGRDRLMHIQGCVYCLKGKRPRYCPVCGASLRDDEYLISRIFERPGRSHVHVIGCNQCRGLHAID